MSTDAADAAEPRPSPHVVVLPSAGVPADHGLSSLGLVMQLGGTVMALGLAMSAFSVLIAVRPGDRGEAFWWFLLLATCVGRSLVHRQCGSDLLYRPSRTGPLVSLRRYVAIGLSHSVLIAFVLTVALDVPGRAALAIGAGLAVWPAVLGMLLWAKLFGRFETVIPVSEDKGFEGASILMVVFGICGALATTAVLVAMFETGGKALRDGKVVLLVLALMMLVVRSLLHVQAGVSGLRTTSLDRSVELANRYASFGIISAFCVGGSMLLLVMTERLGVASLAQVSGVTWMLMVWPMCIRRFFGERQFADLLAGEQADVHRRAPDAGLTGLGWLLIAHAAFTAACSIPQLAGDSSGAILYDLVAVAPIGDGSPWWTAGVMLLEGWAGYELVRMTPHHRIIATAYGLIATAVTVFVFWPVLGLDAIRTSPVEMLALTQVAIYLVIPVLTLILVNRKIAPAARARFRPRT